MTQVARRFDVLAGLLLLVAVVLGGSFIRTVKLGVSSFRADEIQHYHAAESLQNGLGPLNPAGERYERGVDITRMVALLDARVAPPELASRLPAAFFGILNLVMMAVTGWVIGGPWVAFWATLLLAIYPEAIWQSRQVRFYTYQLLFAQIALVTAWVGHERWYRNKASVTASWAWVGATLLAFLLAIRVQVVTLSVMLGWLTFLAIAALGGLIRDGRSPVSGNVPLQFVGLGLAGSVLALVARPDLLPELASRAFEVPGWVGGAGSPLTYYYALSGDFPVLIALAPLAAGVVFLERPWLGTFLLTWFLVPFLAHSLVFPFRQERFLITAVPALFLLGAIAAARGSGAIHTAVEKRLRPLPTGPKGRLALSVAGTAVVATGIIVTTPAFNTARKIPDERSWPEIRREDWRSTIDLLASLPSDQRIALGSTDPLASSHYWGRTDFNVVADDYAAGDTVGPAPAIVLPDPEAILATFGDYDGVLIAVDSARIRAGRLDSNLLNVMRIEAEELCRGRCGTLSVFLWRHQPPERGQPR